MGFLYVLGAAVAAIAVAAIAVCAYVNFCRTAPVIGPRY